MTYPNLLRLGRSCAKWRSGFLLVACLGLCTRAGAQTRPAPVTDLRVISVTDTSVRLGWTGTADGLGKAAKVAIRQWPSATVALQWGSAPDVTKGGCRVPLAGTTVGAKRWCTVLGLAPGTAYQFQLVPFRGILNKSAVFGDLSAVVTAKTTDHRPVPVAVDVRFSSVLVLPPSATFQVGTKRMVCAAFEFPNGAITIAQSSRANCDSLVQKYVPDAARALVTPAQQAVADTACVTWSSTGPVELEPAMTAPCP